MPAEQIPLNHPVRPIRAAVIVQSLPVPNIGMLAGKLELTATDCQIARNVIPAQAGTQF